MIHRTFIIIFLFPLLTWSQEIPRTDSSEEENSEVVGFIEGIDNIQSQIPIKNRDQTVWDIKDIAIVASLQTKADDVTLRALRWIEDSAHQQSRTVIQQDEVINSAKANNFPSWRNPFSSDLLEDISISVGGGISFSFPFLPSKDLNEDEKIELIRGLKDLRDIYESPDASSGQKFIIEQFFSYYLDFDIIKNADEILTENNGMAPEYKALIMALQKGMDGLGDNLIAQVDEALMKGFEGESKIITEQSERTRERMMSEAEAIKNLIIQTNENESEDFASANLKLDYLKKKEIEREVLDNISSITNADKMEQLLITTQDCAPSNEVDRCFVSKEKIEVMQSRLSKLRQTDVRTTTRNGLALAKDVALLFGDTKTANYIAKSIQGYDAVIKISDLASGLASKTAMAGAGDVMSMVSLAISVGNLFGSQSSPSMDELILKQLRQIRLDIEDVRKQMHERFDNLALQIRHLGLGLNLKIDTMGDNVAVIADNQALLRELITNNSFMIADLVQIQSNNSVVQIARNLEKNDQLLSGWKDPQKIIEIFLDSLTEFSSYIKYNSFDSLLWTSNSQRNNYDVSSPEALILAAQVNPVLSQSDAATFGLIDYLIKNSVTNGLGGDCSDLNFNDVYLFNVLGAQVLNILRSEFEELPTGANTLSKYSYVLSDTDLSQTSIYEYYEGPIKTVDFVLEGANRCLNNFAKAPIDSSSDDSLNFITHLIDSYSKELKNQITKVKELLTDDYHLKNLHRAIQNPDSIYLKESMEKLTNVSPSHPERRMSFDFSIIDFSKPLVEKQDSIDQIFHDKYKNISLCQRDILRVISNRKKDNDFQFNPDDYQQIELPKNLLKSIFPKPEMRTALAMNLNSIEICYSPVTYTYIQPFLEGNWGNLEFMKNFAPLSLNGFRESIRGLIISINSVDNMAVQAKSNKDRKHPSVSAQTVTTKVDIFFPSKDVLMSHQKPNSLSLIKNVIDLSKEPIGEEIQHKYQLYLHHTEFNRFINEKFKDVDWVCKSNETTKFTDQCFVQNYKPSDLQLEFQNSSINRFFGTPEEPVVVSQFGQDHELIDVEKSNIFRTQLKAETLVESINTIKKDYIKCYYRTLLGYSDCEFSNIPSLAPERNRVDWTKLNQLENFLKNLVPKFAKFKDHADKAQRIKFNSLFNQLLSSPAYTIINLSQNKTIDGAQGPDLFFARLEAEFESQEQGFETLIEDSENLTEVDIQKLLNMDVYSGLKYYQKLSE